MVNLTSRFVLSPLMALLMLAFYPTHRNDSHGGEPVVAQQPTTTLVTPKLKALQAHKSNVSRGDTVGVNQIGRTYQGGYAQFNEEAYGIRSLLLFQNSSVSIREFGQAAYGGRVIKLDLEGTGRVETRYLINRSSNVTVCFKRKGCVVLRSAAVIKPNKDKVVVGLVSGTGTALDEATESNKVPLKPGEYTVMDANGRFSPAKRVGAEPGYTTKKVTPTLHLVTALDGYQIKFKESLYDSLILPIGTTVQVKTPLEL